MTDSIKTAIDGLAADWGRFTRQHAARQDETDRRLSEIEANVSRAKSMSISGGNAATAGTRDQLDHKQRFIDWIRRPHDHGTKTRLGEAQSELSRKAITIGSDPGGGFAVPELIHTEIARRVAELNPFRALVNVIPVGSSDFTHLLDVGGTGSGWVGEGGSRTETNTPLLASRKPTFGTCYAYPKASEEALQDMFFDVSGWLTQSVAEQLAAAEAQAIVTGDGSNKPTGFLNATPSATADDVSPARAAGALQYLPAGGSAGFPAFSATSPVSYPADVLIDLVHSLKSQYTADAAACAWVMSRTTAAVIRKFKDADGNYLWANAIAAGMPATLAGWPVVITDFMPAIGTNSHPIAFGNWRRAYLLADRGPLMVTIDESITTPGQTKFYVRRRVGGCVLDNQAVKLIKIATT